MNNITQRGGLLCGICRRHRESPVTRRYARRAPGLLRSILHPAFLILSACLLSVSAPAQYLAPALYSDFTRSHQTVTLSGVTNNWTKNNGAYWVGWLDSIYSERYPGPWGYDDNLIIQNSGQLLSQSGVIGFTTDSVLVSGRGSAWNMNGTLEVYANGSLTVNNSATVRDTSAIADCLVSVTQNGAWINSGTVTVGSYGQVVIDGGGVVTASNLVIGLGVDAWGSNTVKISNGGSLSSEVITVGKQAIYNTLSISNRSMVSVGFLTIGDSAPSVSNLTGQAANNTVHVFNDGSLSSRTITVGNQSSYNTLQVDNGGTVSSAGNLYIGGASATGNTVNIGGDYSTQTHGTLYVTNSLHNAQLVIRNDQGNQLSIAGGTVIADSLIVTNRVTPGQGFWGTSGLRLFSGGNLIVNSAVFSNGVSFVNNWGNIKLTGGAATFGDGLTLETYNASLTGHGTVYGNVDTGWRTYFDDGNSFHGGYVEANNGELILQNATSGAGRYEARNQGTLTFASGGSIGELWDLADVRLTGGVLTNNGDFLNTGRLWLDGGSYYSTAIVTNLPGSHIIFNSGTFNAQLVDLAGTNITANTTLGSSDAVAGLDILIKSNITVNLSGNWTNSGAISLMTGGSLTNTTAGFVNASGGVIAGSGKIKLTDLVNNGVFALSGATVNVSGSVANTGTITLNYGNATFSGPVMNSGALITDPSTNSFQGTLTVTSSGYIAAAAGDVYIFTNGPSAVANFVNYSAQSNVFDTSSAKFIFGNSVSQTQNFYTPGLNLGNLVNGNSHLIQITADQFNTWGMNNFALGTLVDNGNLGIWDSYGGGGLQGALFVSNLVLAASAHLLIGSNTWVYYVTETAGANSSVQTVYYDNGTPLILAGESALSTPEPNVLVLWLIGAGIIYGCRRRLRRQAASSGLTTDR